MTNASITQRFSAARGAASRFAAGLQAPVADNPRHGLPACVVHIDAGMHCGAQFILRDRPFSIGSGPDNDVVLRDPGVLEHHAEVRRVDGCWGLYPCTGTSAFPALHAERRGRFERQRHAIGAAGLVISQRKAPAPASRAWPQPLWQAWARIASILPPAGPWARRAAVPVLFGLAAVLGAGVILQFARPAQAAVSAGTVSLAPHGWPHVRLTADGEGRSRLVGYVPDKPALQALLGWARREAPEALTVEVRVGADLSARVREALGTDRLRVDFRPEGVVVIEGTTDDVGMRHVIGRLAQDLAPVVRVEDHVAYVEPPKVAKPRLLPIRITAVRPGENGSFTTDKGERFFVGGVLSDGAEVVAITADAVEFRIRETTVNYPLN